MPLHVVGVRHHSPACARLVETTLRRLKPAYVLIEGPSEMNERLDELYLQHELPLAVFSYHKSPEDSSSCWAPFCDYSPEWVGLQVGREVKAEVRFMDLPGWSRQLRGQRNRYADHDRFRADYVTALCRRLHVDGMDALWDQLFELPLDPGALTARLSEYFQHIRGELQEDDEDGDREEYMAACIGWAMARAGKRAVVAVCGGYHKPYLERAWEKASGEWPALPSIGEEARCGSYLVPYSFKRLDSFVGYQSGMPSPAYYQAVWEQGVENAGEVLLGLASARLRSRQQHISSADLVAATAMSRGLMRLRGRDVMSRCDVLDGLASSLLKEAQDAPPPWSVRGPLQPRTDPVLVEIVAALSGEREGRLDARTPRPPLLEDARQEMERLGLTAPVLVDLELSKGSEREKSRLLHRLRLLAIDGVAQLRGPRWATDSDLRETWKVAELPTTETSLIEAALWGGTLESAALACLEDHIQSGSGDALALAEMVRHSLLAGLPELTQRLLPQLQQSISAESSFPRLGLALGQLLDVWRYDRIMGGTAVAPLLPPLLERALWLLEVLQGGEEDPKLVEALVAVRDCLLHAHQDTAAAADVLQRKSIDGQAPASLRGAALGALWSLGLVDAGKAVEAIRFASAPVALGDYLAGLMALAREQVTAAPEVVQVLDQAIGAMPGHDFMLALPALRLAFSYFPPREKDRLARLILTHHGGPSQSARSLTRPLVFSPEVVAQGLKLEAEVAQMCRRYGLSGT